MFILPSFIFISCFCVNVSPVKSQAGFRSYVLSSFTWGKENVLKHCLFIILLILFFLPFIYCIASVMFVDNLIL